MSNFFDPCKKEGRLKIAEYSKWVRFLADVPAVIKEEHVMSVHIIAEAVIMIFMLLRL